MSPKLKDALRRLKYGSLGEFVSWLSWWMESGESSIVEVQSSPEGATVVLHWPDGRRGRCAAFALRPVPVETMTADDFIRDYGDADLWTWCGRECELVYDNRAISRRKCCEVLEAWIDTTRHDTTADWQDDSTKGWAAYFGVRGRSITEWANSFDWIEKIKQGRYRVNVNSLEAMTRKADAYRK